MSQPSGQFSVFYGGKFPNLKVKAVLAFTDATIRLYKSKQPYTTIFEANYADIQRLVIILGDIHFHIAGKSFTVRPASLSSFLQIRKRLHTAQTAAGAFKDYSWLYAVSIVAVLAFVAFAAVR